MTKAFGLFALGCALLFSVVALHAEEIRDYYAEPGLNPFKDSINQHFNEHIDPFSGTLQLKYVDLSIPGNGGMDINVTRVYTSLQTNAYPTLGLNGLGWTMHFGRIVTSRNHADKLCNQGAFPFTTMENPSLEQPDGGRELLVLNHISNDNSLITRSNWRAVCMPNGVGMLVTSPDGTKYTMNQYDSFQGEPSWLTTRIEDLHGNWIRIDYQVNAVGVSYIDKVYRSEEGETTPVVTYEYESQATADIKLSAISANGQRVEYRYEPIPGYLYSFYEQLTEVIRPDGSRWGYAYNPKRSDPDPNDGVLEDGLASYSLTHIDYPYGADIDYTYQWIAFDPGSPQKTTSILTKTVSGTGVTGGTWSYAFAPHSSAYNDSRGGQLRYDVTTIAGPDDIQKFYHFGKDYRPDATYGTVFIQPAFVGTVALKEIYSRTNTLLQRTGYSWGQRQISTEDFYHGAGYRSWWRDEATYVPVLIAEYTDRDSRAPADGYLHYVQYFEHDVWGNPGRVYESSSLTNRAALQKRLTYHIDTTKWILHLVEDEQHEEFFGNTGSVLGTIEREYDANGKLLEQTTLGVTTEYTYNQRGDVATIEDARGNIRHYSNYKRGIPRLEQLPESVTLSRTVNDTGTVSSETNGRGFTTSFDYDALNRLTSIDFPIKADVSINYASASGGYRRTLTRDNYRQAEVMNDFGQVTRIERSDTLGGQLIYRTKSYDASGRETFVSYPNATVGITTTYDALSRVRRTQHPDGTGVNYVFDDIQVQVTNERGFVTNYLYQVLGVDFGAQSLASIGAPQNVGTIIEKDAFDNTTRVFQGELLANGNVRGYGREYEYDSRNFLIRAFDPEVGTTVFTHDAIGNVLSERVNDAEPVLFTYDNLNRRRLTDFSGTALDVATSYDRNGNVQEVSKGTSRWVYGYDDNDNLSTETLTVADPLFGARSYVTGHAYNNLDVQRQITYPSGLAIDYAPDAFGRATQVGTFASNITYHPSGQLQSYRLANGVVTNVALNARLLTQGIQAGSLVNLGYTYDPVGNVTTIVDGVDSTKSVRMNNSDSYDGLDRLVSASGSWGVARFTYDYQGNIVTKRVGADSLTYQLDDRRRVNQVRKIDPNNTTIETARIRMDFDTRGNAVAKRRYLYAGGMSLTSFDDTQLTYGADSTLLKARVANVTSAQSTPVVDKHYLYDGNGQRFVEKKHGTYNVRYSVHSRGGDLLFEDSIVDCVRTDYIRLGALALARSDDQRANPALDTDGDRIDDCMEYQLGLDPNNAADASADADGDGLSNLQELNLGTSLWVADTDHDGLSDLQETNQYLSDPTLADSDGDGLGDATEALDSRLDPRLADADHDGVSDGWETQLNTNPQDMLDGWADTDGDGFSNRQESLLGSDPLSTVKSPARGQRAWTFEMFGIVYESAAIGPNGVIYATNESQYLYAINPDGTQRWRYSAPGTVGPPTVAPNGTIYVPVSRSPSGEIHAVNPDGTRRWMYQTPHSARRPLSLGSDGRLYYAGYTQTWNGGTGTYVINGVWQSLDDSGNVATTVNIAEGVPYGPVVGINGDAHLYFNNGELRVYDERGTLKWTYDTGDSGPGQAPVLDGQQRIYLSDVRGAIYALSSQGQLLWTRPATAGQNRSSVSIGPDGTLYIGAYDSKLYAVNPADGTTIWEVATYGTSYTPAVGADGTIYVTNWGGAVSAYAPTGTLLWRYRTDDQVSAPPTLDRDGTLYFGSRTGQLYAVVDNSGGPANTSWPMFRHDQAGTSYVCFDVAAYSTAVDSDGDGIADCVELKHGLDPNDPNDAPLDLDGDGLSNAQEYANGTDISNPDTDADGLSDGQEVLIHHTDPLHVDSDGDAIGDGQEVQYGLNPLSAADAVLDADGDGYSNRAEAWGGSDLNQSGSRPTPGTVASVTASGAGLVPAAIASDGTLYRVSENRLEALDANFKSKWTRTGVDNGPPSIAADGTLYSIADGGRQVVALYPNGNERWRYQVVSEGSVPRARSQPLVRSDGTLFVSVVGRRSGEQYDYQFVAVLDPRGRLLRRININLRNPSEIALDNDGNLIAYNTHWGTTKFRSDTGERLWGGPGNSAEPLYANPFQPVVDADSTAYVVNSYGMHAASPNGTWKWTYSAVGLQIPVITPGGLILQSCKTGQQATLCAIRRDGTLAWSAPNTNFIDVMVGQSGIIYVTTYAGVSAFNEAGTQLWNVPLPGAGYPRAVLLDDGMIYVADGGRRTLIIGEPGGLADGPWPTPNRDYKNSRSAAGVGDVQPSAAPTVGITSPDPFRPLNLDVGQPFTLTAYATDAVDGNLGSSIVWTSNIDGALGNGATLATPSLTIGIHTITAAVTDSSGLTAFDTMTVNLGYVAPVVTITAPLDGDIIETGDVVTFMGEAEDIIDGELSDSIQWSSNLDGVIGTGRSVSTSTLRTGQHVITARAMDSSNTSGTATIQITMEARPPSVGISQPANYGRFELGTALTFSGNAVDQIDGNLAAAIEWRSSIDGLLYTGSQFTTSALSEGEHEITASVADSGGAVGIARLTLFIGPQPPIVSIPGGSFFTIDRGYALTLSGVATDLVDGDLSSAIRWTSLLDGLLGTGSSISTATLSAGEHQVTLSATDSAGLTGTTDVLVIVYDSANSTPSISMSSPAENAQFFVGDAVRLQGNATDPEQGNIRTRMQWSSNLDGALGTGSPLTIRTLRAGEHTIKAMVTDNGGAKAAITRTITVRPR